MNKLDSVFENSKLIAKKITGRLTGQEKELFDQWISNSPQNQKS